MFWIITVILAAGVFVVNMFSGGGSPRSVREIFFGNYYAEGGVLSPEDKPNSKEAFAQCIEQGFGIKTQVQLTGDRKLVLCSDLNLLKNFGQDIDVSMASSEAITALGILTLQDLLDLTEGKVPLILELKTGAQNDIMCRFVADAILAYEHRNICVASFHSGIIAWFKHTEKTIFRGLISAPAKSFKALPALDRFMVGNLANNSICRPHFVLYRKGPQSILVKFAFSLGSIKGVWDCHDKDETKALENEKEIIVFSGFTPDTSHYKDLPAREKTQAELDAEAKEAEKLARRKARIELAKQDKPVAQNPEMYLEDEEQPVWNEDMDKDTETPAEVIDVESKDVN